MERRSRSLAEKHKDYLREKFCRTLKGTGVFFLFSSDERNRDFLRKTHGKDFIGQSRFSSPFRVSHIKFLIFIFCSMLLKNIAYYVLIISKLFRRNFLSQSALYEKMFPEIGRLGYEMGHLGYSNQPLNGTRWIPFKTKWDILDTVCFNVDVFVL